MRLRKRRPQRYHFAAAAELTNLESSAQLKVNTTDLNLKGCHVSTETPWPLGTKVRIRIARNGSCFAAFGQVGYVLPMLGMGIIFMHLEPTDTIILDTWIAELRGAGVA